MPTEEHYSQKKQDHKNISKLFEYFKSDFSKFKSSAESWKHVQYSDCKTIAKMIIMSGETNLECILCAQTNLHIETVQYPYTSSIE